MSVITFDWSQITYVLIVVYVKLFTQIEMQLDTLETLLLLHVRLAGLKFLRISLKLL